jgi:hypothetical protein
MCGIKGDGAEEIIVIKKKEAILRLRLERSRRLYSCFFRYLKTFTVLLLSRRNVKNVLNVILNPTHLHYKTPSLVPDQLRL